MRSPNELVPLPKFRNFREKKKQQIPGFPKKVLNEKKFSSRPPATLSLGSGTPNESYPSAALIMYQAKSLNFLEVHKFFWTFRIFSEALKVNKYIFLYP